MKIVILSVVVPQDIVSAIGIYEKGVGCETGGVAERGILPVGQRGPNRCLPGPCLPGALKVENIVVAVKT
jgi:hypothetical protein